VPKKPFITLTSGKNKKPGGISEKVINIIETYTMIARKKYPSVKSLAEHFNVSERTVHRYLEIIKLIDVVDYDREKKGYFFPYGDRTKKTPLTENELSSSLQQVRPYPIWENPLKKSLAGFSINSHTLIKRNPHYPLYSRYPMPVIQRGCPIT
jgi:DNA-binding transcriptional regulator YhcF (GntR family)